MKLFLDVDGVLLGRADPRAPNVILAAHAAEFLRGALASYEVYWATTNCDGTTESVVQYLRPYCSSDVLALVRRVRPTKFATLKTELFDGLADDFVWIDDQPLQAELRWLADRGWQDRLLRVDTRRRPDDLARAIRRLT